MTAIRWRRWTAILLLAVASGAATGCSVGANTAGTGAGDAIVVGHAWTKAPQDERNTAAFGMVMNATASDKTVISAASAAASSVELHETTETSDGQLVMTETVAGFPLPAGQPLMLEPGGDHLMLIGLEQPLQPGDEITITLMLDDGTEIQFAAPVKDFRGANGTSLDE